MRGVSKRGNVAKCHGFVSRYNDYDEDNIGADASAFAV